jgi:hypothetical protein
VIALHFLLCLSGRASHSEVHIYRKLISVFSFSLMPNSDPTIQCERTQQTSRRRSQILTLLHPQTIVVLRSGPTSQNIIEVVVPQRVQDREQTQRGV